MTVGNFSSDMGTNTLAAANKGGGIRLVWWLALLPALLAASPATSRRSRGRRSSLGV